MKLDKYIHALLASWITFTKVKFYKFGHDPCWRLHITYQQFIMAVPTDSSSPKKHQTNKSHVTSCFNKDIHVFSKMVRRTSEAAGTLFAAARGGIRSFVALNEVWGVWEEEIDNNQHHRLAAFSLHTIQDACSLKRETMQKRCLTERRRVFLVYSSTQKSRRQIQLGYTTDFQTVSIKY